MEYYKSIVYNEDCINAMRLYTDNYFDIAIVDPPYGINAPKMNMGSLPNPKKKDKYQSISTAERLKKGRLNSGGGKLRDRSLNTLELDWDNEVPTKEYFDELFRISKNQIIWGGNYFNLPPTRCIIVWDKCQPWDNFSQFEMAWTSFDKPAKLYKLSNTGGSNKEKKINPTQKPVKLYDKTYLDFCEQGMIVLDTHLGSGSNRITAQKANCHFIGYEKSKEQYESQEKRFNSFQEQKRLI